MKELVRTFLFFLGYIFHKNRHSRILYYHDFHSEKPYTPMSTSLSLFAKHLDIIRKNGFIIVSEITNPYDEVVIMLDDGFRGIWDNRQFFFDRKIQPTIFIAKSLVGQEGYLTESEIKELDARGWIFQSHTVSHKGLNKFCGEKLTYELKESKKYLENLLGHSIDAICAPQGYFTNIACEEALRLGYNIFYSSTPGSYFERITDFSFVVTRNLCQSLNPFQFKCALLGGYEIFQRIYFKRRYNKI